MTWILKYYLWELQLEQVKMLLNETYITVRENAAVGFDVLTTCQPSTIWCSRERLPAAAAQPAKVRQSL
jgi:hypothetical protein